MGGGACPAVAPGAAGDFGPASDPKSFTLLSKHLTNNPRAHEEVGEQALADAGVMPCACCSKFFGIVGPNSAMQVHWCSPAAKDTAHLEHTESMQGDQWLRRDLDRWRQMAAPD